MTLSPLAIAHDMALEYHAGQKYGVHSYFYHLDQVAMSVGVDIKDYKHTIVAYLHDILEDTECTEQILRENFSADIVDAVVAITKVKGENYFTYIYRVSRNKIAHTVKIHDTLCNLTESVKTGQWRRVDKYANQLSLLAKIK